MITVVGYVVALIGALWLVYMGICTGESCGVPIYPPGSGEFDADGVLLTAYSKIFEDGVELLRSTLPWLIPTAFVVFISLWIFLGWALWIKSPSAWNGKSGMSAFGAVVILFGFAIWLTSTTLPVIKDVDGSIAYWISLPSFICATVAFLYLGLWFVRERDSTRVAYQLSGSIERVELIANRARTIERSGLLPQEKLVELKQISELSGLKLLEDEINRKALEMIELSDARTDLRAGISPSSPPKELMLYAIAASQNQTKFVNGPFWQFAKAPAFRSETEWGLKALASELSAKLDRLNASIGSELKLIWDDLEKLERDAGKNVVDSGEWLNPDEVAVIAKFGDSGWDKRRRPRRPSRLDSQD